MKATELKKQSEVIENLYRRISEANAEGQFKIFIPHFVYVKASVQIELIQNGFKVYKGSWDGVMNDALIIEW